MNEDRLCDARALRSGVQEHMPHRMRMASEARCPSCLVWHVRMGDLVFPEGSFLLPSRSDFHVPLGAPARESSVRRSTAQRDARCAGQAGEKLSSTRSWLVRAHWPLGIGNSKQSPERFRPLCGHRVALRSTR